MSQARRTTAGGIGPRHQATDRAAAAPGGTGTTALDRDRVSDPGGEESTPPREIPSPGAPVTPGRAPGPPAVLRQVERILASGDFDASPRSRELLHFVVEEALAGRGGNVTQSAIATRVFRRREDFDPTVDPIVRIQAGRLRRSLERYYLLSGKHDTLRIELPRGTYVPTFGVLAEAQAEAAREPPAHAAAVVAPDTDWPTVLIRPFEAEQPGPEHAALAARVTEELGLELGRHRDLRTVLQGALDQLEPSRRSAARFSIGGRLRDVGGELRVTAQLVDRATGEQLWGDEYHTAPGAGRWSGSLDDVARVIAVRVGGEEGIVVQRLVGEFRNRRPAVITPFGAILLSYEFFLARDPQTLLPTLEALRHVVKVDPECGVAWSRLARVILANYAFELTPVPTPIEEAISCAHHAARIDPTSRRARCILAAALLVKGELRSARDELEEALRLSSESLVWLEHIGYFLCLLGDGDRGTGLIREARRRNPYVLPNATMGLWFEHLRRGEIQLAYQVALEFRDPTYFWRGVMRGSCLGLLGRGAEAEAEIAVILEEKPDFPARGRTLIGHYVKLPDVFDRVLDGLSRAGLDLA
jgi:TolB-like protein